MRRYLALAALCCFAACNNSEYHPTDAVGTWGGEHVRLTLEYSGGALEYDCAHGHIAAGWTVSGNGDFHGTGTHVQETGGPGFSGDSLARPARYDGSIGDLGQNFTLMKLTVTLTDSSKTVGTFTLVQGSGGSVVKCALL